MSLEQISDAIPSSIVNLLNTGNAAPVAGAFPSPPVADRYGRFTLGHGRQTFKTQVMFTNAQLLAANATPIVLVPAIANKIINLLVCRVYLSGIIATPAFNTAGFALTQPLVAAQAYVAPTAAGATSIGVQLGATLITNQLQLAAGPGVIAGPAELTFNVYSGGAASLEITYVNAINQPLQLVTTAALTASGGTPANQRFVAEVEYEVIDAVQI